MYRSHRSRQSGGLLATPAREVRAEIATNTVWVLDREHSTRESIRQVLRPAGYVVQLFERPESLFDCRVPEIPVCLIIDYELATSCPESILWRAHSHAPVSVIFLSYELDLATVVKAIREGGFEFLLKPIDADRLFEAVQSATEHANQLWSADSRNRELWRKYETLTKREREVLPYVASGFLNKQTAYELGASEVTIRIHRGQIMRKMGAATFADLVKSAARIGIVDI